MVGNIKKSNKGKGLLILKSIEFDNCLKRGVIKNNDTSGKVSVPSKWIGKEVYVVLVSENE